jgi:hypothetical protein
MSQREWFWLIVDSVLIAVWIWQVRQLFAPPEESTRLRANIGPKEGDHAADQESP